MCARYLMAVCWLVAGSGGTQAAKIDLIAGGGPTPTDVTATEARLKAPFGIEFDAAGNGYIVELTGQRVLKVDSRGRLTTLAGSGQKGERGDGGAAGGAEFNGLHNLAVTSEGDIYLADTWNCRVRRIDGKSSMISTIAGTGIKGFAGDGGPAEKAQFGGIYCVALAPDGRRLYMADLDNRRIRVIDLTSRIVTTIAGNGQRGVPRDGTKAVDSPLVDPRAVAADSAGNVYVLERGGHALRVVSTDGTIRTVAGTGQKGLSGDGGPARSAMLSGPKHLCIDRDGDVLIADSDNHCIRKYSPKDGSIVRVAGTGKAGKAGLGGPPEGAELNQPHGVTARPDGTLFIADSMNDRVLKIVP